MICIIQRHALSNWEVVNQIRFVSVLSCFSYHQPPLARPPPPEGFHYHTGSWPGPPGYQAIGGGLLQTLSAKPRLSSVCRISRLLTLEDSSLLVVVSLLPTVNGWRSNRHTVSEKDPFFGWEQWGKQSSCPLRPPHWRRRSAACVRMFSRDHLVCHTYFHHISSSSSFSWVLIGKVSLDNILFIRQLMAKIGWVRGGRIAFWMWLWICHTDDQWCWDYSMKVIELLI